MKRHIAFILIIAACIVSYTVVAKNRDARALTSPSTIRYDFKERTLPQKPSRVQVSSSARIGTVVVKFKDESNIRIRGNAVSATQALAPQKVQSALRQYATRMTRQFAAKSEAELQVKREQLELITKHRMADLNSYYRISVTSAQEAETLVNELNALEDVEIAYAKPLPEPAGDIAPPTPSYIASQDYREAAPAGVDADFANTLPGGDGSGVKIIDIEGAWRDDHEDLDKANGGLIAGTMINDQSWRDHGTAVVGVMIANPGTYGVTGICPGADLGMVSIGTLDASEAIMIAADSLNPGDLILIELHAPGPRYNFESRSDQLGYVCMEYWQDNFDAIQYAWAQGIIVVEAGGNGAENLDDVIYNQVFDTTVRNSHAIVVGAGYPAASASDRQRLGFSNYGERVNLQGYGSGVYTTGYGGLFTGGGDERQYYTSSFSGTSSASPIVTGSVACLQGRFKALYGTYLTSDDVRKYLVATGSAQLGNTAQHIGPRPDLQAAFGMLTGPDALYTLPLALDTTIAEGQLVTVPVWLHNRSTTDFLTFAVNANDSLAVFAAAPNWLTALPTGGTIAVSDSTLISVSIDGSLLSATLASYKGVLEITWGVGASPLDSLLLVPVFVKVPCNDTTYSAASSDDVGGPIYSWISAKTIGTKVPNGNFYHQAGSNPLDDGTAGPLPIGFSFPYYDVSYSNMYVSVNGAISFTDPNVNIGGYFSRFPLPGAPFTTLVAPLWDDLVINALTVPQSGVYIWTNAAADTTVIEWYRLGNFVNFDTLINFELILTESGGMTFQYKTVQSSALNASGLVGIGELACKGLSWVDGSDIPAHVPMDGYAVHLSSDLNVQPVQSGDLNDDSSIDIADLQFMVDYLFFSGATPDPFASGDCNCDSSIDIADLQVLVDYLFFSGPLPCSYFQVN